MKRVSFLSGVMWMSAGAILTRVGSLVTQIVLVYLLIKEDFGIYAIVFAFYLLGNSLRDGGVNFYLTHKSTDKFNSLYISAFWLAVTFNIIIALTMIISAPYIADYYGDERIINLLNILAISIPLRTPASILINKLSIDGKFIIVTKITTTSALLKFLSWITLAWLGYGPFSFVLAIPFIAVLEGFWSYSYEKKSFKTSKLNFPQWHAILKASKWIIIGQFAIALLQGGDYLVLGLFISTGMLGVYYFAFELVAQIGVLLGNNVQKVLYPTLTNLRNNAEKQRSQIIHALTLVMSIGPFLSMLIAISIEPLSNLLGWSARFPGIVAVVQILALFFPLRILTIFTTTALMTLGEFKKLAIFNLIQGVGLIIVSFLASHFFSDLVKISLAIGFYLGFSSLFLAYISLKKLDITPAEIINIVVILWISTTFIAVISYALGGYIIESATNIFDNNILIFLLHIATNSLVFISLFILTLMLLPQSRNEIYILISRINKR